MAATQRIARVSKNTVARLLVYAGEACSAYQDRVLRENVKQKIHEINQRLL